MDRRLQEHWTAHGVCHAIRILMEAGVPPEHHDALHEYVDEYERRQGDLKREPRSKKYKELRARGEW